MLLGQGKDFLFTFKNFRDDKFSIRIIFKSVDLAGEPPEIDSCVSLSVSDFVACHTLAILEDKCHFGKWDISNNTSPLTGSEWDVYVKPGHY